MNFMMAIYHRKVCEYFEVSFLVCEILLFLTYSAWNIYKNHFSILLLVLVLFIQFRWFGEHILKKEDDRRLYIPT